MAELRSIDVTSGAVRLAGVLHLEPSLLGRGYALHRLPGWTQPQVVDPALQLIRGMPSGCRIEMDTEKELAILMRAPDYKKLIKA